MSVKRIRAVHGFQFDELPIALAPAGSNGIRHGAHGLRFGHASETGEESEFGGRSGPVHQIYRNIAAEKNAALLREARKKRR